VNVTKYLFAGAGLSLACAVTAGTVPLPGDVAVTLAAPRMSNLTAGEPVAFTMTVTNQGPLPIRQGFWITGPNIFNQLYYPVGTWNDCGLVIAVVDSSIVGGSYWFFHWDPAGPTGELPINVGETRSCHFSLALTPSASVQTPFRVGLFEFWSDPNPSNDHSTVYLQRALDPIPTLSRWVLLGLAGLLAAIARRRLSLRGVKRLAHN
jgi:hypothetical protein